MPALPGVARAQIESRLTQYELHMVWNAADSRMLHDDRATIGAARLRIRKPGIFQC